MGKSLPSCCVAGECDKSLTDRWGDEIDVWSFLCQWDFATFQSLCVLVRCCQALPFIWDWQCVDQFGVFSSDLLPLGFPSSFPVFWWYVLLYSCCSCALGKDLVRMVMDIYYHEEKLENLRQREKLVSSFQFSSSELFSACLCKNVRIPHANLKLKLLQIIYVHGLLIRWYVERISENSVNFVGSFWFPECLVISQSYDVPAEWWLVGCIMKAVWFNLMILINDRPICYERVRGP